MTKKLSGHPIIVSLANFSHRARRIGAGDAWELAGVICEVPENPAAKFVVGADSYSAFGRVFYHRTYARMAASAFDSAGNPVVWEFDTPYRGSDLQKTRVVPALFSLPNDIPEMCMISGVFDSAAAQHPDVQTNATTDEVVDGVIVDDPDSNADLGALPRTEAGFNALRAQYIACKTVTAKENLCRSTSFHLELVPALFNFFGSNLPSGGLYKACTLEELHTFWSKGIFADCMSMFSCFLGKAAVSRAEVRCPVAPSGRRRPVLS